jgi:murein DD-endopeptidase MepM/ murein hydrolase activator NlpD
MTHIGLLLCFVAGVVAGTSGVCTYTHLERLFRPPLALAATLAPPPAPVLAATGRGGDDLHNLLGRELSMPIASASRESLLDTFARPRPGKKTHEAIDILAPRGTPIHALADGFIRKLSVSPRGGITIYEFDPEKIYCYSYAHLDRYANHLKEGLKVRHGDVIGYVGTTGDAPANAPHLHLAIARLNEDEHWWEGAPVNPYPILMALGGVEGTN